MLLSLLGAVAGLGSVAFAAPTISKQCVSPESDLCYELNIPDSTAQSGSGDVFIQIKGSAKYGWAAIGTGSTMAGSKMMVIYPSANGQNVTLSTRSTSGHVMPKYDSSIQAYLMEGSGLSGGEMTANIRCTNCGTSKTWIYAALLGSVTGSDDVNLAISQHNINSAFQFGASGGPDQNPFTAATSAGSGSGSASTTAEACPEETSSPATQTYAAPTTTAHGLATVVGSGFFGNPYVQATGRVKAKRASATGCATSPGSSQGDANALNMKLASISQALPMKEMAHGILAGLCFAVFFPFGAISIRLFSFNGLVWFHAGIQVISTVVFIVAVGLGISMVQDIKTLSFGATNYMSKYHPIIGLIVFAMVLAQPVLGRLHHNGYKATGGRTAFSYLHLWVGRILITLGVINGGLGFLLAGNTSTGPIAYAVVAAVFYLTYIVTAVVSERRRALTQANAPPKYDDNARWSGNESPGGFYGQPGFELHNRRS